ncbi:unnamed protein product [Linum trigynum]
MDNNNNNNGYTYSITDQDISKQDPVVLFSPNHTFETIFLSNIDQAVSFPVETLFFFRGGGRNDDDDDIAATVRRAVEEDLLVPYYFMAGRLQFNEESSRLELVCNNAGAVFVEATSRLAMEELGDVSLPNPCFRRLIHRPGLYKSLADTPLMTIQVTKFVCGGYSIGFVTNHGTLDGKSAGQMFESLASICRGEGLKPNFAVHNDRTSLRARTPPRIQYPHHEYVTLRDFSSSFTALQHLHPSPLIFSKNYVHKLFSFSYNDISTLKEKANIYGRATNTKTTSFEAVVAHVWRSRTRAVFADFDQPSTVLFAVDVRSLVTPALPEGFVGNAVITAFATARAGDLVAEPVGYAVGKMKEGRERVTDDYVRSVIDWLEVHRGGVPATRGGNFYVSAWWKLPFNELDFGSGKPVHGGPVVSGNDEFVLLLADRRRGGGGGGGGVSVWLGLEEEKMDKFMGYVLDL